MTEEQIASKKEHAGEKKASMKRRDDHHELGKWRVNGQLPHIDAWYEAFGITEQDPMFVPKDKRVTIW